MLKQMPTLESILPRGQNNFDLVRLIAALGVIFGHSFALFPTDYPMMSFARMCVSIFFFISGILVTSSFVHSGSVTRFVLMRIGRIWPGLLVCLFLTAFVLGPIVTTLSVEQYFVDPATLKYFATNATLSTIVHTLPGVFEHTFYPGVNGSLWTLPPEIRCYVFVFFAGILGMLASRKTMNLMCLTVVLLSYYFPHAIIYFDGLAARHAGFFLLGMFAFSNRDFIRLDWKVAALFFAIWAVFSDTKYDDEIFRLCIIYAVLVVAASEPLRKIKLHGDYSYGVYIYGYVVQETIGFYFPMLKSLSSMLLTVPISLALGFISWNAIEKPALSIVSKLATYLCVLAASRSRSGTIPREIVRATASSVKRSIQRY